MILKEDSLEALRILRDLAELQNGSPLATYEKEYDKTMTEAWDLLNKYDPIITNIWDKK
ncbi:hypothetical protein N9609_00880 [bacterium]|nr:hypothetical protein [bacterium]